MKLLVHNNNLYAIRAMKILGLDPEQWKTCGYGDMLGGEQFDQIVVVSMLHAGDAHTRQWFNEDLTMRLAEGSAIQFL